MSTIIRHGGEAHVMRPDGVYRTGVLQPMAGYHPGLDVQAVAGAFTARGLSGFAGPNILERIGLRMRSWFSRARAMSFTNVGPATEISPDAQVAPQMAGPAAAVSAITGQAVGLQRNAISGYAAQVIAQRRFNSYYNAG